MTAVAPPWPLWYCTRTAVAPPCLRSTTAVQSRKSRMATLRRSRGGSTTKLHQADCCAFMNESLKVYSIYLCWPWPLTYLCYLWILFWGSILTTIRSVCYESSQICPFLALRPEFHSNLRVILSTPRYCQSATFGRLTFAFILLLFLRNSCLMSPRPPRARHAHHANRSATR